jgi:serine/threonine-protein kinase
MRRGLKVRPRGVVARFKGADQDPREVGRELGVQVVVDGSVRRRGGSVRINARMVSVADGFQLWARRLERPEGEVLRLNDEVAQAVAEALTIEQTPAPARDVPNDPIALDLYLRARHEYRKFWPANLRYATELYGQALARCPGDPMILAGDALARCRLWFFAGDGGEDAIAAAERAVAGAPDLADARLALASVRLQAGESPAAVRELKLAIRRNPYLAEAHSMLGMLLLEAGAVDDGRRRVEAALSLDPEAPLARGALVRALVLLGRWEEAMALIRPVEPGDSAGVAGIHLRFALWRRDVGRAQEIAVILEGVEGHKGISQALLHVMLRRENPARPEFLQIEVLSKAAVRRRAFVHQLEAEIVGYLGRKDEALASVARSVKEGLIDLLWLDRCPLIEPLHADPRFAPLREEVSRRADAIVRAYREG